MSGIIRRTVVKVAGHLPWIRCPGCGRKATIPAILCADCKRDRIPRSLALDLDSAASNPTLLPQVAVAVLNAVARSGAAPAGYRLG